MRRAIINVRLYDFEQYIDNAYVVFDKDILAVGTMSDYRDNGLETIDGRGQLLMPGLVCGHTHIYSTFARGLSLPFNPKNFQDVLDQLWWKLDRELDNDMTYHSGIVAGVDFVKNGVTTLIDHHASGADIIGSLEALYQAVGEVVGLRGIYAFEVSDRFYVESAIEENIGFAANYHCDKARGLFGLHASMSLSTPTLVKVRENLGALPIHIHVAESKLDVQDCQKKYGKTIIERLDEHELINKDSIIVHAIHVTDHELEIIKKRDAVIAVNVSSNMNNGVGIPDIMNFQSHGVRLMLGNDGLSSGMAHEYLSAYYAMHHLGHSPIAFGLGALKEMIAEGYRYAGAKLNIKLGKIKTGYAADFLLLPYDPPTPMNADNAFGHLFFGLFHSFKPKDVYVGGKPIVINYGLADVEIKKQYAKAIEQSQRLWNKLGPKE